LGPVLIAAESGQRDHVGETGKSLQAMELLSSLNDRKIFHCKNAWQGFNG